MISLISFPHDRIIGALRKEFSMSPIAKFAMEQAVSSVIGVKGGKRWRCSCCGLGNFTRDQVQLDHTDPVVPLGSSAKEMSWDLIIDRMFKCPVNNLKCLCKECHRTKTNGENEERNLAKKVTEAMQVLPSFVTYKQAEDLIKAIPGDLKISGKNLGIMTRIIVKWFNELEKK